MLILQDILSQEIVQRLGWTLLNFIWQAAAVALILTILLRLLRKSTANLRYIIACLALALIVLLPVITFKLVPVSQPLVAAHFAPATAPTVLPIEEMPAPETIVVAKPYQPESVTVVPAIPFKERAVNTLEPALPYIVSGWLIGVFGLSIWHLGGWTQLQRLKRRMVRQVDSTLLNKLKVLTQKLKVKQTVQLMESALVQIPTVVGWLKPVILLPASALTGLSSEQLEAIIAHELAHIKRFDYLINILQTVVEILGFYHPAVWWISHKIRAERENCCDDMAVSISGDRLSYAGALASMEEIRAASNRLAVAATGGNLFRRICRLLGKDSTDNTGLSWVPAATAILLIIALAIPTTLALTNKSDSTLIETKTEVSVEDDIQIATAPSEESPAENIPPVPILAKSPAPPDEDKAHIKANFFVVEVPPDSNIDAETLKEAEKILGGKVSFRNTKVNVILRKAAQGTAAVKDESDRNKRVTEKQFNALVKMLNSKGYIKILMNPTIETLNGKTATVKSTQHVPLQQVIKSAPDGYIIRLNKNGYVDVVDLIEITPHIHADGHIILDVEADLGSQDIPLYEEPGPVSSRQLSSKVCVSPGESVIIGGFVENHPAPRENINNNEKQAKELLLIITPTIITPPNNSPPPAHILIEIEKVQLADKLKRLGVAVAMYADDHDDNLPESIQELKPYLLDERDFDWFRDNVEYFDKGKTAQRNATYIPIAYDKTLLEKADGTNVLFLDSSVRFRQRSDFEQLNLKRAEFLIEAWFLAVNKDFIENINHNADSPDEAKELLKLKSELLAAVDGSNKISFIHSDRDVSLLLKAVMAHKDSKVIATPQVTCLEGKRADIAVMNNETYYIVGYTEPNSPSEKPQPKLEKVEEGIELSLWPKLTPKKYIDMQFESVVTNFLDSEERKFEGKAPYKPPTVQRRAQSTRYVAKDGDTLLFGGHKIADSQDDRTEQKDLLILIKASTIDSSEEDKPAKTENLIVAEPPTTTTNVITPPAIAKSRTERPKDNEQNKTKADETITEIFEIHYGDPVEIVEILKKLINGRHDTTSVIKPDTASVIESSNGPILLIPEPTRKWIIAKASPENINQIGQWIKKLDIDKSTMGLDPMDKAVHEQLEMIVDLSELAPQMSFGEVIEILENSVEPPLQIQPIWKDLLDNAEVEEATPAGMDPLPHVKLRKALEILLTSVSSTGLPKLTYIVDEGVILIGTKDVLPPKMSQSVYKPFVLVKTTADANQPSLREQDKTKPAIKQHEIVILRQQYINNDIKVKFLNERILKVENDLTELRQKYTQSHPEVQIKASLLRALKKALRDWEEEVGKTFDDLMKEETDKENKERITALLDESEESMTPLEQVQKQLVELIKQQQALKATEPNLPLAPKVKLISKTLIDCPLLEALQSIATAANVTIIPDETVKGLISCTLKDVSVETALDIVLAGTPYVWKKTPQYYLVASAGLEIRISPEVSPRVESAMKLSSLGKSLLMYAKQHDDKYPDSLFRTTEFHQWKDFTWIKRNVEYLGSGKSTVDRPDIPLAYDKTLLKEGKGTIVLYNDCHLSFEKVEKLKKLGISGSEIMIETVDMLPPKMVHRVYDISDLVSESANYRMSGSRSMKMGGMGGGTMGGGMDGGMGGGMMGSMGGMMDGQGGYMQAQSLVQLIQETIEPDSWADISDTGEGTIMAYPIQSPRKLAVMQTYEVHQEIDKLLNVKRESLGNQVSIYIKTVFLSVSEDYLKYVGLDPNSEDFLNGWTGLLAEKYPAGPNGQPYGLIIDDIHVRFLLRAVQAHDDSKAIVAPRVHTRAGTTADTGILEEYRYIKSYNEPNSPSKEPQPKRDKEKIGTHIWITPKLTDDNRNVNLDLKLEIRQLTGIIEGKYKEKYPTYKPIIDVISEKMLYTIPKGKTILIGGLKIIEPVIKKPGTPGLKDLPLIGAAFSSKDKAKSQKMLLIMLKPVINPQQKAAKVRPGREVSEEQIKRLAEQLDKKINTPASPNN
ncbi:MAG: M48 family metalloprotease [Planctomycetes bacterium]|nr:M48 family metalloprotease [Planctomycetota bacterium]MBL7142791.1 M48 family metalloprotease [Phycisphaerae bacterium]